MANTPLPSPFISIAHFARPLFLSLLAFFLSLFLSFTLHAISLTPLLVPSRLPFLPRLLPGLSRCSSLDRSLREFPRPSAGIRLQEIKYL